MSNDLVYKEFLFLMRFGPQSVGKEISRHSVYENQNVWNVRQCRRVQTTCRFCRYSGRMKIPTMVTEGENGPRESPVGCYGSSLRRVAIILVLFSSTTDYPLTYNPVSISTTTTSFVILSFRPLSS